MSLSDFKPLIALLSAILVTACGGGHGSSAPPPVGGLVLEPGEGGVTITWTAVPGVDYWAYTGQSTTICKNCGNSSDNWNSLLGAQSRGWATPVSTPYFFTGNTISTSLNNDVDYAFIMDGRINGGPGGEATPSASTRPRLNGANWFNGGTFSNSGITGLAFGPKLNTATNSYDLTGTYLALGSGGSRYQSPNGLTWTRITTENTTNWKSATYAFAGMNNQKFVGVGAAGALIYSTDLATFTSSTSGSYDLNAVASNTNTVVAVGNHGTILRSTDGVSWSAAASVPITTDLYAVTYATVAGGGVWVAVGAQGKMLYSADASSWTLVDLGISQDLKGVASLVNATYPNRVYSPLVTPTYSYSVVAVGNAGVVTQSSLVLSDWTTQTLGSGVNLNAIVASSAMIPTNQFMIVGDAGKAFTSPNGLTWTPRTTTSSQNLTGLIRGYHNQYLAWAANGTTTYSK